MKHIAVLVLVGLSACGPDPEPTYSYKVNNTADFAVVMSCQRCESVTIQAGEQMILKTNTPFRNYQLTAAISTTLKIDFEETGIDEWTIRSYEFDVIYEFGGDDTTADVTFLASSGNAETHTAVAPTVTYQFRDFETHNAQISATNKGASGYVKVTIYYKEKIVGLNVNTQAFGTATSSVMLTEID